MYHCEQFMNVLKTYTHSLMNQKELEEEQRLIAVNQIRKSELKAKQKMYASSTTFGRKMVSQYTLTFAEFLKNKIENTIKGRFECFSIDILSIPAVF